MERSKCGEANLYSGPPDSSRYTGNGKKDGTSFNLASTLFPNLPVSDETVLACVTQMKRQWNIDSGASDHMSWDTDCYESSSYQSFDIDRVIQGAGGTLTAIGVGDVHLTIQAPGGHYHDIVLTGVLHCPVLFTNLISASSLRKKGWYLHGGTETLNRCDDDFQLASTPIQNGLYVLQALYIPPVAAVTYTSAPASLKSWHRRLGHPSYANLKRFGNARGIDMSKMKVDQEVLLCKICIKAKQKRRPSYKIQHPLEDICEKLHVDLMGPITPTGWNGYKYSLTITDGFSRCRWVENMYEKREAGLHLKQFVTFIEKQTGKSVKRLRLDQGQEFGV